MIARIIHHTVAKPWLFDRLQSVIGYREIMRRLVPYLMRTDRKLLLDVGSGTGMIAKAVPQTTAYIWYDNDPQKLGGYQARRRLSPAILGDATRLCIREKSIDYALCVNLTHHLSDDQLRALFAGLARVVREGLFLVDAVTRNSMVSRLLWRYDRGSHPRSEGALCTAIERCFECEEKQTFEVLHSYVLWVGVPKLRC